jgi:Zn-dependent protease
MVVSPYRQNGAFFLAPADVGALERRHMESMNLASLLVWYAVFLFSTTFHEFLHGLVAYRGGDPTAQLSGQVTLDPLPHIQRSPFGMIVWPLLSFLMSGGGWMFGWASAPYDRIWALRHPRRFALMSLAGPFGNFVLVALGIGLARLLVAQGVLSLAETPTLDALLMPPSGSEAPALGALSMALSVLISLNVVLGVFNLLPVPPLDGFGVLEGLAPAGRSTFFQVARVTPAYQFLGMILAWTLAPKLIHPVLWLAIGLVFSG